MQVSLPAKPLQCLQIKKKSVWKESILKNEFPSWILRSSISFDIYLGHNNRLLSCNRKMVKIIFQIIKNKSKNWNNTFVENFWFKQCIKYFHSICLFHNGWKINLRERAQIFFYTNLKKNDCEQSIEGQSKSNKVKLWLNFYKRLIFWIVNCNVT